MFRPAARAWSAVGPTEATSGWVKMTCGTAVWSAHAVVAGSRPAARAAMGAPQDPALVLAHVGEQREVVHVPGRVQPAAVHALDAERVVHVQPRARLQAHGLQ